LRKARYRRAGMSYAEVKAIASGNPAVLTLAEADAELQRLSILKKNHSDEQFLARRNVRTLPDTIASMADRLEGLTSDLTTVTTHAADPITVGDRKCGYEDVMDILGGHLDSLNNMVSTQRSILWERIVACVRPVLHPHQAPDVYLDGAISRRATLFTRPPRPRPFSTRWSVWPTATNPMRFDKARLAIARDQLRDYESVLAWHSGTKRISLISYRFATAQGRPFRCGPRSEHGTKPAFPNWPKDQVRESCSQHRGCAGASRHTSSTAEEPVTQPFAAEARCQCH